MPIWARVYCGWAAVAIGFSLALGGLSPENVTRLLVLAFLAAQLALRPFLRPGPPSGWRFVALATLLACVVEGLHMISRPVFLCLTVKPGTPLATAVSWYVTDLAFTVPAYLIIFSVIWRLANRYRFSTWSYAVTMGLAQALGDGGLVFFLAAPPMLLFLPYPMTNYHAINVLPYLLTRPVGTRPGGWLAIPALIVTYWLCGALIQVVGRSLGYS